MQTETPTVLMPPAPPLDPSTLTLRTCKFFDGLEPEISEAFTASARWHEFYEGDLIFDQASDSLEVHFVLSGAVRLLAGVEGGEHMTLAEVTDGGVFGELAAIDSLPRSATAVAVTHTILGSIPGPDYVRLLGEHPKVAVRMLKRLASIIRAMDVRLANTAVMTPTQRVIAELMRRAEPDSRVPGNWIIPFAPTHGDIAGWTGVQKEVVAQAIGGLARNALLRRRGGSLVLLDWAALQQMVKPRNARQAADEGPAAEPERTVLQSINNGG